MKSSLSEQAAIAVFDALVFDITDELGCPLSLDEWVMLAKVSGEPFSWE